MKRFLGIICTLLLFCVLGGCTKSSSTRNNHSSNNWQEKYYDLQEKHHELSLKYEELLSVTQWIYDEVYVGPYDLSVSIAMKHDKKDLFPPMPSVEDLNAILFCYIEGEPDVTKAEARQAYAAYKEYTSEMSSILYGIQYKLDEYFD